MPARNYGFYGLRLILITALTLLFLGAILFVPAGTLDWPEAWLFIALFLIYSALTGHWLRKNNPKLLKERTSLKSSNYGWDKLIVLSLTIFMLAQFIAAGIDYRFGWSEVPLALKAVGFVGVAFCLCMNFLVMRENTFLSRIVEVQKERNQKVISTGPYSIVRHPMYAGFVVLFACAPLALGSLYALIPGMFCGAALIVRTYLEDKMLQKELRGYKEYTKKVRYKLLPWVW